MKDWSIDKNKIQVSITFADGSRGKGEIFLAYHAGEQHGGQKVADLLNGDKAFLPISLESGSVEFISKSQILTVEGELVSVEDEEVFSSGLIHQKDVVVVTSGNQTIVGSLLAEVPEERSRLSDCLNLPEKFIRIKAESRYLHINKAMIKKITARN
ncbi:MAG: hypothetical protein IMF07_02310 [Proteobacteria bacterium]|nr:hypothetical protein [Pseudomonadota bacterium]